MAPLWAMRRIKEDHLTKNLISDLPDHIDDVIGDKAISLNTRGTEGTLTYEEWNSCDHCGHAGESQPEIQHDMDCPVGWFQDLADDVRNPKPKETK